MTDEVFTTPTKTIEDERLKSPDHNGNTSISIPVISPNQEKQNNEKVDKPLIFSNQLFTKVGKVDVPAIYYLDLETIEKKGWQEENAVQSDYFNYGIYDINKYN